MDCGTPYDKPNFDCEGECLERYQVEKHSDDEEEVE